MTANTILQFGLFTVVLFLVSKPIGIYIHKSINGKSTIPE